MGVIKYSMGESPLKVALRDRHGRGDLSPNLTGRSNERGGDFDGSEAEFWGMNVLILRTGHLDLRIWGKGDLL